MKKLIFGICLLICAAWAGNTAAQATRATAAPPGGAVSGNAVTYNLPQTVLNVEITVQREIIRRGPYSRYAQQFLGSVAPLSDRENYTILGAVLTTGTEADPSATYVLESPDKTLFDLYYPSPEGFIAYDGTVSPAPLHAAAPAFYAPAEGFEGVLVDKMSMTESGLEEAAAEAARTLFTLRKRRFDLVSGEAGENVYGAGMEAALEEMKRLEEEYTALFMGKRTVRIETRTIQVVPEKGKNTLIVCRFTEAGGILPDNDLSGRPIVLELTPENKTASTALPRPAGRETRGMVYMRVADMVRCRLIDDKTVFLTERVPVYQFGETVEVPVTSLK